MKIVMEEDTSIIEQATLGSLVLCSLLLSLKMNRDECVMNSW